MGDINLRVDGVRNNDAQIFLRLLNNFSRVNLINKPTYNSSHTWDLVITKNHHVLVKLLTVDTINTLTDHRNVIFDLHFKYAKVEKKTHQVHKK